LKGPCPRPG